MEIKSIESAQAMKNSPKKHLTIERIILSWTPSALPWKDIIYLISLPVIAIFLIWLNEVKAVAKLKNQLNELRKF